MTIQTHALINTRDYYMYLSTQFRFCKMQEKLDKKRLGNEQHLERQKSWELELWDFQSTNPNFINVSVFIDL